MGSRLVSDFDFGGAFRPKVPDLPPPPTESDLTLARLEILIRELGTTLQRLPQPEVHLDIPELTEMVNAVVGIKGPATAEEIADAMARRLRFPEPGPATDLSVLADLKGVLEALDFRLKGQAFGTSVTAPADTAKENTLQQVRDRGDFPWSGTDRAKVDALGKETTLGAVRSAVDAINADLDVALSTRATEATLASVLASVDTLEALTTDVRTELRRRPVHRATTALTVVPAGAVYTTVVAFTPTTHAVVEGYNADFESLMAATYRLRLITGEDASPTVWHGEEVNTTANSWVPLRIDVAVNTRVAVQVVHDQVTGQNVRGTLNYYEEP